jgi:hypothetical protein
MSPELILHGHFGETLHVAFSVWKESPSRRSQRAALIHHHLEVLQRQFSAATSVEQFLQRNNLILNPVKRAK